MSTGVRLTFLYPHLLRATAAAAPALARSGGGAGCGAAASGRWKGAGDAAARGRRTMRASARASSSFAKRAGKAVEPLDWEKQQQQQQQQKGQQPETLDEVAGKEVEGKGEPGQAVEREGEGPAKTDIGKQYFEDLRKDQEASTGTSTSASASTSTETTPDMQAIETNETVAPVVESAAPPLSVQSSQSAPDAPLDTPVEQADAQQKPHAHKKKSGAKPKSLEAVYLAGAPESAAQANAAAAAASGAGGPGAGGPSPQRYIHHFDSYSLVKQLQDGGYTSDQAITAMKAIRGLLARNLDLAQETLVSKSDVENESYLFSAACSELSAEMTKNRRSQDEHMRQQRTHLQHEVDILTQSLNQELLTLNDNVRGLFNDRRMAVREQQKTVDSAIQQINYKMSIMLSSDSKSEIEGVRWILIRRSVVGIIFMAILTLGTIRYATYVSHERAREAERRKREREREREGRGEHHGHAAGGAVPAAN